MQELCGQEEDPATLELFRHIPLTFSERRRPRQRLVEWKSRSAKRSVTCSTRRTGRVYSWSPNAGEGWIEPDEPIKHEYADPSGDSPWFRCVR